MGRTRRIIVEIVLLLIFRVVTHAWSIVSSGLQYLLDVFSQVGIELTILGVVLLDEYTNVTVLFVSPVGTGLLYLTVFSNLVRVIYPDSLWDELKEAGAIWIWLFKFLISLHILAVYLVWTLVLPLKRNMGYRWFLSDWYGFSPMWWFLMGSVVYFGLFVPGSVGYVLSIPEGGLLSKPKSNSVAFKLQKGFSSEVPSPEDIDSAVNFWLNQGVWHTFPIFALGILFISFEIIFPAVEIVLAIGVFATLSPWYSFPPGNLDQYDLEDRLAATLRFTTLNFKGLVTALVLVGGIVIGGLTPVILISIPLHEPPSGPQFVAGWNRFGFVLVLLVYAIISTLLWLSLADRLPWFISNWTKRNHTFSGRSITPSGEPPQRFAIGLSIPAIWLLLSLALPYSTHGAGSLIYALVWPICAAILVSQSITKDGDFPPATDNVTITWTVTLQTFIGLLAVFASSLQRSIVGLLPNSIYIMFSIVFLTFMVPAMYILPEAFHWVNKHYSITKGETDKISSGKQGKQRKARILFSMSVIIVLSILALIVMMETLEHVPVVITYLLVVGISYLGVVYWMDAERFQPGGEFNQQEKIVFWLLLSIATIGLGISTQVGYYFNYTLINYIFVVAGVIGLLITTFMLIIKNE